MNTFVLESFEMCGITAYIGFDLCTFGIVKSFNSNLNLVIEIHVGSFTYTHTHTQVDRTATAILERVETKLHKKDFNTTWSQSGFLNVQVCE